MTLSAPTPKLPSHRNALEMVRERDDTRCRDLLTRLTFTAGEGVDKLPATVLLEEGFGVAVTWYTTAGTNSWSASEAVCATHGKTLCTRAQMCPHGHSGNNDVEGGKRSGDTWAPAADEDNTWVAVGTGWPSCQKHSEINNGAYGKPAWVRHTHTCVRSSCQLILQCRELPQSTMASAPTSRAAHLPPLQVQSAPSSDCPVRERGG